MTLEVLQIGLGLNKDDMLGWIKFLVIGVIFALVQGPLFAEGESGASVTQYEMKTSNAEKASYQNEGGKEAPTTLELVGRIVVYLILLAIIGAVVLHFFKQGGFTRRIGNKGKLLKVTETHMLGNKQFLVVVEYGQHKVLLGVGPGMINKLCFLDDSQKQSLNDSEIDYCSNKQ